VIEVDELKEMKNLELIEKLMEALAYRFTRLSPEEWVTAPTMMVDINVPEEVRELIRGMAKILNTNQSDLESTIFNTFILEGFACKLKEILEKFPTKGEFLTDLKKSAKERG
jgi:hypothetical protein